MQISRQADPRANQKARTRAALVQAARQLMRDGVPPSVAEAADAALISRATAYRYFPTQEALLLEVASVSPAVEEIEAELAALPGADPAQRLDALLQRFNAVVFDEEASMRASLRVYLDTWLANRRNGVEAPVVREGRRMRWFDQVLAPARAELGEARWQRLRAALALTLGADAMVVMRDVCRLEQAQALSVLRWAAGALLQAALDEARHGPAAKKGRAGSR